MAFGQEAPAIAGCDARHRHTGAVQGEDEDTQQADDSAEQAELDDRGAPSLSLFTKKPPRKVPPPPAGTTRYPNRVAASEALRLNWDSKNLGLNVDMPVMSVASVAPARHSRMNVGFFRRSQMERGRSLMVFPKSGLLASRGCRPSTGAFPPLS